MTIADLTDQMLNVRAQADTMNPELLANDVMPNLHEHMKVCKEFHAFVAARLPNQNSQANDANLCAGNLPAWVLDGTGYIDIYDDDFDMELWMRGEVQ
jgi:hypothetical protein